MTEYRATDAASPLCPVCGTRTRIYLDGLYDDRYAFPGTFRMHECPSCQHKHLDARFSPEELSDLYTRFYPRGSLDLESYQPLTEVTGFRGWLNGEKRAFAFVPRSVRVLDIGCGFGESLGYHQRRGCEVYGVDADSNIQRVADRHGFKVHVGTFNHGVFPENFFDYVTMDQVLEHVSDPHATLDAVTQVLKPGGKLIITVPNANGWGARRFGRKWIHWHTPYHLQFYSRKSLALLAGKSGLKMGKIRTITSSEWLFYQRIQNLVFPEPGMPSPFFSPKADWSTVPQAAQDERARLTALHRRKIHHWITRYHDLRGQGDNLLVTFRKAARA